MLTCANCRVPDRLLLYVGDEVEVSEDDALGHAGRPGGERENAQVLAGVHLERQNALDSGLTRDTKQCAGFSNNSMK